MVSRRILLASLALSFVVGAGPACGLLGNTDAHQATPIHSGDQDGVLAAVGYTGPSQTSEGCSATLIAPELALLAAHCVVTSASRCYPPNGAFKDGLTGVRYVYFSASGFATSSDVIRFPIIGIATHPSSFPDVRACGTSATHTCASLADETETNRASDESHDLALVHLGRGADGLAPNFEKLPTEMGLVPAKVITSIVDSATPTTVGKHVQLVVNPSGVPRAFDVNQATRANPTIVGWGRNDVPADASAGAMVTRYSGLAEFEYGAGYLGFCIAPWDCDDNLPSVGACQSGINSSGNARLMPTQPAAEVLRSIGV